MACRKLSLKEYHEISNMFVDALSKERHAMRTGDRTDADEAFEKTLAWLGIRANFGHKPFPPSSPGRKS